MEAALAALVEQVRAAAAQRAPLRIRGSDSKAFYGPPAGGSDLDVRSWRGIVSHEPSELVVTVRAGTPLAELEAELARAGQALAFEPPHFGPMATVGGCIAAGLAGPRRMAYGPVSGAVRDHVLGARLIDGRARVLGFGGTVMKNVAGYDVARALAGSLGVLGVIVDVSLKVLPMPECELTLRFELDEVAALERMTAWARRPLPVSATFWHAGQLHARLSGMEEAVGAACRTMGGERLTGDVPAAPPFWVAVREQTHAAFSGQGSLWRFALPANSPPLGLEGTCVIEWSGTQRWLRSTQPHEVLRRRAAELGGHATLFRGDDRAPSPDVAPVERFTPLAPAVAALHARLKHEFDPERIFNRGRMYAGL